LKGTISGRSGGCPAVAFSIDGQAVVTDANTDYKKSSCDALANGMDAHVRAQPMSSGPALALSVDVKKGGN
jgi:Domain of unknown function (DUF5666)